MKNEPMLLDGQRIQIATAGPLSGKAARLGKDMIQAVELAVEEQNDEGGIFGTAVRLLTADDESRLQKGESVARQFCEQPGVLGIVGHYNSDVTMAAAPIYQEKGLPLILPVASNPVLTESGMENVFRLTNRDDRTGIAIARYLYNNMQKRKAVVIRSGTAYGNSMSDSFIQPFTAAGGQIVFEQEIPEGYRELKSLPDQFPADHDLLFYGGYFEGAGLLQAYRDEGFLQLFAAGDGCWDVAHFLEPAGVYAETGEGVLILSASPEIGRIAGSGAFRNRYEERYGKIVNYAVNAYDSARVLMTAIKNAALTERGVPTPTQVTTALRDLSFRGICYPHAVEWDEKGDNTGVVTALNVVKNRKYHQVAEVAWGKEVLRQP